MPIGSREEWLQVARRNLGLARQEGWGEHQTRRCVVEPVLAALGVEVWDPAQCREEEGLGTSAAGGRGTVDYLLLKDGDPYLAIEAKAARENPEDSRCVHQLANYLQNCARGPRVGVTTNGAEWVFLDPSGQRELRDRVRWRGGIETDEDLVRLGAITPKGTEDLLRYWQTLAALQRDRERALARPDIRELERKGIELAFSQEKEQAERYLLDVLASLVPPPPPPPEGQSGQDPPPRPPSPRGGTARPGSVGPLPSPYALLRRATWRGVDLQVRKWKDVLVAAAEKAVQDGRLVAPLYRHKRMVVAQRREDFAQAYQTRAARPVGSLWVDTCFAASDCVDVSRFLLDQAGLDPSDLVVEWDEPRGR